MEASHTSQGTRKITELFRFINQSPQNMHFWSIESTARAISRKTMSEAEKTRYYLGGAYLFPILMSNIYGFFAYKKWAPTNNSSLVFLAYLLVDCLLVIAGFAALWRYHTRRKGLKFLENAVCLALPASVRTIVVGWLLVCAMAVVLGVTEHSDWLDAMSNATGPFSSLVGVIYFKCFFFFYMFRGFSLLDASES